MDEAFSAYRVAYARTAGRSLAMPIAGALVWLAFAIAGALLPERQAGLVMLFGSGVIFPLGLLLARVLGEDLLSRDSPFARLMGASTLMVNLLWPLHIVLFLQDPDLLPLTLGVGLGLHWIVFGWIVRHPVGLFHAIARSVLLPVLWVAFPDSRFVALPGAVTVVYVVTIVILVRRADAPEARASLGAGVQFTGERGPFRSRSHAFRS